MTGSWPTQSGLHVVERLRVNAMMILARKRRNRELSPTAAAHLLSRHQSITRALMSIGRSDLPEPSRLKPRQWEPILSPWSLIRRLIGWLKRSAERILGSG